MAVGLGLASVAVSAYSAYDSYSSGQAAASTQGRVEAYNRVNDRFNLSTQRHNAEIDEMFALSNIKQQQEVAQRQHAIAQNAAAWQAYQNDVNRKIVDAVATAQVSALRQEAGAIDRRGRESISRSREQGERLKSTQRARTAKAGVALGTGTPLDVAIETAGNIELAIQDQKYGTDMESTALRNQARQVDYERDLTLELDQVSSDYGISKMLALSQFERDVAGQRARIDTLGAQTQNKLANTSINNSLWGVNNRPSQVPAMQAQNTATLLSGVGNTLGAGYNFYGTYKGANT